MLVHDVLVHVGHMLVHLLDLSNLLLELLWFLLQVLLLRQGSSGLSSGLVGLLLLPPESSSVIFVCLSNLETQNKSVGCTCVALGWACFLSSLQKKHNITPKQLFLYSIKSIKQKKRRQLRKNVVALNVNYFYSIRFLILVLLFIIKRNICC